MKIILFTILLLGGMGSAFCQSLSSPQNFQVFAITDSVVAGSSQTAELQCSFIVPDSISLSSATVTIGSSAAGSDVYSGAVPLTQPGTVGNGVVVSRIGSQYWIAFGHYPFSSAYYFSISVSDLAGAASPSVSAAVQP